MGIGLASVNRWLEAYRAAPGGRSAREQTAGAPTPLAPGDAARVLLDLSGESPAPLAPGDAARVLLDLSGESPAPLAPGDAR